MKKPKTTLSIAQVEEKFCEQIGYLKNSCKDFDSGNFSESKRIAGVIRTLVHDTKESKSVLGQLGLKSKDFLSTVDIVDPAQRAKIASWSGICGIAVMPSGMMFYPPLSQSLNNRGVNFQLWWSEVIMLGPDSEFLTRNDVIMTIANQEGQHVDDALDTRFYKLRYENGPGWTYESADGQREVGEAQIIGSSIRQVAHELLTTLDRSYVNNGEKAVWSQFIFAKSFSVKSL